MLQLQDCICVKSQQPGSEWQNFWCLKEIGKMEPPSLLTLGCKVSSMVFWNNKATLMAKWSKFVFFFLLDLLEYDQRLQITHFSFVQNISGGKFCRFLDLLSWTAPRFRSKVAFGDMRVVGELSSISDRLTLIQLSFQKYLFKVRQRIITISLEGSFGTKLSRRTLRRWMTRKKPASFGELWSWHLPLQFF